MAARWRAARGPGCLGCCSQSRSARHLPSCAILPTTGRIHAAKRGRAASMASPMMNGRISVGSNGATTALAVTEASAITSGDHEWHVENGDRHEKQDQRGTERRITEMLRSAAKTAIAVFGNSCMRWPHDGPGYARCTRFAIDVACTSGLGHCGSGEF